MSKYARTIPLSDIEWIRLYHNTRRVTLDKAMAETGADTGLNGGLFNGDFSLCGHVKADGKVLNTEAWGCWGFAWNTGPDIKMVPLPAPTYRNYISGTELLTPTLGVGDKLTYPAKIGGRRGRRAEGLTGTAIVLYATSDGQDATTLESLQAEMARLGCETAIAEDGGQSVKVRDGATRIEDSDRPVVATYVLIKLKKEDKPVGKKHKVCIDPGHGVETAGKCAPDKSYYEHEFNLDISKRQKAILERHGIEVSITRNDKHDISLEQRVKIANGIGGLDLFISNHSNASGNGAEWTSPDGYGIYTSAAGVSANRNILASKLLTMIKGAGIKLWGNGLFHEAMYVCKNTVAPAILVEHGFHTNKEETARLKADAYRQKLAELDCKGILSYLGIPWQDEPVKAPVEPEKPVNKPWYADDQTWAKDNGVSDGTRPEENVTRAEVWAMLRRVADMK